MRVPASPFVATRVDTLVIVLTSDALKPSAIVPEMRRSRVLGVIAFMVRFRVLLSVFLSFVIIHSFCFRNHRLQAVNRLLVRCREGDKCLFRRQYSLVVIGSTAGIRRLNTFSECENALGCFVLVPCK